MSEAIEKYRGLGEVKGAENLSDIFGGENPKELTPEKIAQVWEGLSDLEKKFITCDPNQFESIISEYESAHGLRKATIIKALRKLVLEGDPRASAITGEMNEAAG
ncbi:MAG: hypothetical protein HY452_01810 [Parcubacteria group bacterium]|nr:hypothetical protein [Parcubacteria group bacterium]